MGQRQLWRDDLSLGDGSPDGGHWPGQHYGYVGGQFWVIVDIVWVGLKTMIFYHRDHGKHRENLNSVLSMYSVVNSQRGFTTNSSYPESSAYSRL